ncbi:hypothetical protein CFHF_17595 [Caulobacter flavus]|uniref:DUF6968 domain-containing protein n=1 Tax=Caulobacter flavus TaxID=1679497 RepID=A0A2N5CQQ9_9CAUL|nr:hypothetical protein [Caulobacter flavus]AYV48793.1 hypothetical protein C1707_22430 [Caulobacter flavus]PLR10325.1 hypothetical protein CFHF_17595 [Caulobacter flavus]
MLCRWLIPEPHPKNGWRCEGQIVWPDGRVRSMAIGGEDSLQALRLAMMFVATELLTASEPVYLSAIDDDLDLPLPDVLADLVAERKARFEAR